MHRENKSLTATLNRQQLVLIISSMLLFSLLSIAFTTQALANTNAKGVLIEFMLDDEINKTLAEPKPLDEEAILALTPTIEALPYDNNIWLRIQAGYAMPDITSRHTTKFENWYSSRPEYIEKMMARSEKYLFYVVEEVERRGMPTEIALLPMIESAYNPKAYSRSHAAGIWQFIPSTGKHFGLNQNWWVDNRRHVTAATHAALDYLQELHARFGSWDLALAAYNAGQGTVGRAIIKNQKAGKPTNYQSLKLPLETVQYVPKLQAIKNIVTNPSKFGLAIAPIHNQAYFDEISAPDQIDAKLAAKLAEISHKEFVLLNPSYNRPVVASKNNTHKLLLPITAIETFQNNLNKYDQSLISWKVYKGKRGERLSNIAKNHKISVNQLRQVNDLPRNKKLSKTLYLLVPTKSESSKAINVAKLSKQKTKVVRKKSRHIKHRIKRGETLSTLARKYGTNTRAIMKMNRLKSTRIKAGQIIKVRGKPRRARTKKI